MGSALGSWSPTTFPDGGWHARCVPRAGADAPTNSCFKGLSGQRRNVREHRPFSLGPSRDFSSMPVLSAKILSSLADPNRLRLLKVLVDRPAGVRELAEIVRISQPNASRHLKALREAGIVVERRFGTRREQHIVEKHRCEDDLHCLDFGFCIIRFDRFRE